MHATAHIPGMSTPANTRGNLSGAAAPLPAPSACRHCHALPRYHGWMSGAGDIGLHQYTEPTAEQRKERILASLAAQKAARATLAGRSTP